MMPGVAQEVIILIQALLPGFIAAWVFYGLTSSGHFVIAEGKWLDRENNMTPLKNVWSVLIPAVDVRMVEFLYEEEKQ
jgi:hypothetical protein